jgi:hypothetical protein
MASGNSGKTRNRHHTERIRSRRRRYDAAGHSVLETPTLCSCWMCGNPRKWTGIETLQERKRAGWREAIEVDTSAD